MRRGGAERETTRRTNETGNAMRQICFRARNADAPGSLFVSGSGFRRWEGLLASGKERASDTDDALGTRGLRYLATRC